MTRPRGQGSGIVSGVSFDPLAARVRHTQEEHLTSIEQTTRSRWEEVRLCDPLTAVTGAEPIRRKSSTQKAVVVKFDDHLTTEVAPTIYGPART